MHHPPTHADALSTWSWRPRPLLAGLDGVALVLPTSLGGVLLVFLHVGPAYLGSGILAAMFGLALLHLFVLRSSRPVLFSARLFEATTLAAMLSQLGLLLPGWGLPDTPEVRMAFLCAIGGGAGLVTGLLYLLRADRLTRYIPAPVFSGFSNSIAALLVISQLGTLRRLLADGQPGWLLVALALTAGGVMMVLRLRFPKLPAAAAGLAAGTLLAQGLAAMGHPSLALASGQLPTTLPIMDADFAALAAPGVQHWSVAGHLAVQALILGVMAFINTAVTLETFTQIDGRRFVGMGSRLMQSAGVALASLLGAPVLTASQQGSNAAMRTAPLSPLVVFWAAMSFVVAYVSGLVLWMPVAAICGVMIADAWFFIDRASARGAWRWLRRQPLSSNAREDLALVAAVTLAAVALNMVAAALVGMLLGLLLFAMRNARKPVRHVWHGGQVRSNCARPRVELTTLDAQAHRIKVFELEGDLFFASATTLYEAVDAQAVEGQWVVLDWSRTRHVDSSVVRAVARLYPRLAASGAVLLQAGVQPGSELAESAVGDWPLASVHPDLDRALEVAENAVLAQVFSGPPGPAPAEPASGFLRGLDEADRARVLAAMRTLTFQPGELVLRAGDPSETLMLVLAGSASVVVRSPQGNEVRLSTVLPGATLGEIGFLDGAPRSAHVVATSELTLACLDRPEFERIGREHPHIVQRLLSNIAVDIAARLRSVSTMVTARARA